MRRAILAAASTVAALVLLLGFKTQPLPTTVAGQGGSAVVPGAAGSGTSTSPAPDAGTGGSAATSGTTTVTGQSVGTRYGPVQVQVVATGTRVEDVTAVTLPSEEPRSVQLSQNAAAELRQDALDAQSAEIDMVSGATYTSEGYQESLQSALDQLPPA